MARYFVFQCVSGLVALLHLLAEWLYMGRPIREFSVALLAGLLALAFPWRSLDMRPGLKKKLHATRYAAIAALGKCEAAAKSFRICQACWQVVNLVMIAGLVVYVWRFANPYDAPRFISSVKFGG